MLISTDGRLPTNGRPAWIQHSRHSTVVTVSGSCLLRRVGSPLATEHRQHLHPRAGSVILTLHILLRVDDP